MRKPTKTAKPATVETETVSIPAPAVETVTVAVADPVAVAADRIVARDAAGIARFATNYSTTSNRDDAYRALAALAANGRDTFTLRDVFDVATPASTAAGKPTRVNPFYTGSAKATDVGAFNRLRKAGDIVPTNADCTAFAFTERGATVCRAQLAKRAS
jgi:hypothetical protein